MKQVRGHRSAPECALITQITVLGCGTNIQLTLLYLTFKIFDNYDIGAGNTGVIDNM